MDTIAPLQDDDLPPVAEPQGDIKPLRAQLEARCAAVKIPVEEAEESEPQEVVLRVGIPCGRDRRWIYLWDFEDYQRLLAIPFEQYAYLQGLEAVCNYKTGTIEAAVRPLGVLSSRILHSRIHFRIFKTSRDRLREDREFPQLELSSPQHKPTLILGSLSKGLEALVRAPSSQRLSLSVKADGIDQHDKALDLLRRISDALFFQIDLLHDVPLALLRERRAPPRRKKSTRGEASPEVTFPDYEYDAAPVSLYWYARSAGGMPLLQYLAYYQVIEYYFPTYSQADARRRIRAVLKDPAFRGDRDADLGRLLSAIHVSRSGAVGDERSQLRATLLECIDADTMRQFITADTNRANFLSSKAKGLCDQKIPVASSTADLRPDVAERIYEIRCKIVHTKMDAKNSEFELLLPFSKEAEQLTHDIDLVQFVAQKVLIAASSPFRA